MSQGTDMQTVGVVGAGAMGRGIAQVAAVAGLDVLLFDARTDAPAAAKAAIGESLARQVERGRMTADAADAAVGRIACAARLEELKAADLVIEAIVEDLAAKQAVFRQLEAIVADSAVLASNTSSLSITAIAAACERPERVAGLHFFNPVPAMQLVEVVPGLATEERVVEALLTLAGRIGKRAVRVGDTPGFLVNHVSRGYGPEALRILSESIATAPDIDAIMRACGFRMGPIELLDLTGMDVSLPVMEQIYRDYYEEPSYRPSLIARRHLAAGFLGRKSGRGFYEYAEGKKIVPPGASRPAGSPGPIWIDPQACNAEALSRRFSDAGAEIDESDAPSSAATCVVAPLGRDATTTAVALSLDAGRVVAVDTLLGGASPLAVMRTPLTEPERAAGIARMLGTSDAPLPVINDSPGFVAQRILAMIVNVACGVAQQRIAAPPEIDLGARLGLAYPKGPLEWGDEVGASRIVEILDALYDAYRDPRYRASIWLRRRAQLGVSLLTLD
jgi:3-hydroxybutyryl-CoA dehydrogenase